jgi:Ca-activated chloride channel family protein
MRLTLLVALVVATVALANLLPGSQVVLADRAGARHTQTDDIPPIPEPIPMPPPLTTGQAVIELHRVDAVVDGPAAQVYVKQVFRNDGDRPAEGVYVFPLPKDAVVSDFQMTVDGQTVEGKLLSKEEARAIYDEIVRRQLDPALLEYLGRGLFQASVFPIPPHETRTVEFSYAQTLARDGDLFRFNYPLAVRPGGAAAAEEVSVAVELRNQPGLRTIYSPNYPIRVERLGDDAAEVSFEATGSPPQSDFDLYFGTADSAIGANLLSYKPAAEDGFFVLLLAPTLDVPETEVVARDIVLVLDVSGSMRGEKIEQARAAAKYVVDQLNSDDRFNIITFSTGTSAWERNLQEVTAESRKDAIRWLDRIPATGSTDINRALLEAEALFEGGAGRPAYILFITDGQPTQGEQDPDRIIDNALDNRPEDRSVRLFTFGVGYDVNTDLLDILSRELGGRASYVEPAERVDEVVGDFYSQISTPVLTDVEVELADARIDEVFPHPLPDLFAGDQIVVAGRYRDGGTFDVELRGTVNGEERLFVYPDQELTDGGGESFEARLWATRKIGALLDEVRRNGPNDELIDAITELSLTYGIVTPYTSFLVLEPGLQPPVAGGGAAPAATEAPLALMDSARAAVQESAAGMAAAAPAGEAAVQASKDRAALLGAETVRQEEPVRFVAGKTFTRRAMVPAPDGRVLELWVDTAYAEEMPTRTVRFGSPEYFDLLDLPDMPAWLAIAPELILVLDDGAVRVTTVDE